MSKVKKWKLSVLPKGGAYIHVIVDAETSHEATKIVKAQHPNAQNISSPTEVK